MRHLLVLLLGVFISAHFPCVHSRELTRSTTLGRRGAASFSAASPINTIPSYLPQLTYITSTATTSAPKDATLTSPPLQSVTNEVDAVAKIFRPLSEDNAVHLSPRSSSDAMNSSQHGHGDLNIQIPSSPRIARQSASHADKEDLKESRIARYADNSVRSPLSKVANEIFLAGAHDENRSFTEVTLDPLTSGNDHEPLDHTSLVSNGLPLYSVVADPVDLASLRPSDSPPLHTNAFLRGGRPRLEKVSDERSRQIPPRDFRKKVRQNEGRNREFPHSNDHHTVDAWSANLAREAVSLAEYYRERESNPRESIYVAGLGTHPEVEVSKQQLLLSSSLVTVAERSASTSHYSSVAPSSSVLLQTINVKREGNDNVSEGFKEGIDGELDEELSDGDSKYEWNGVLKGRADSGSLNEHVSSSVSFEGPFEDEDESVPNFLLSAVGVCAVGGLGVVLYKAWAAKQAIDPADYRAAWRRAYTGSGADSNNGRGGSGMSSSIAGRTTGSRPMSLAATVLGRPARDLEYQPLRDPVL